MIHTISPPPPPRSLPRSRIALILPQVLVQATEPPRERACRVRGVWRIPVPEKGLERARVGAGLGLGLEHDEGAWRSTYRDAVFLLPRSLLFLPVLGYGRPRSRLTSSSPRPRGWCFLLGQLHQRSRSLRASASSRGARRLRGLRFVLFFAVFATWSRCICSTKKT